MNETIKGHFENLEAASKEDQYVAFNSILAATEVEVSWAYEVWDQLVQWLTDADNHRRSRAAQFLAHLAISDPEKRIINDFPTLWKVTYDPKFVTARHSLQAIWRVGLAGQEQKELIIHHFIDRFQTGVSEKHYTLIRFDMIQGLKNLYDQLQSEDIKQMAMDLIDIEEDPKYKNKYLSVWK